MKRKELKSLAKEKFLQDRKLHKEKLAEIKTLEAEKQADAKKAYKQEKKAAKKDRKAYIKELKGKDKREAKKHDKFYKKYKRRPIRYTKWGILSLVLILIIVNVAPIIGDVQELLALDINTDNEASIGARENGEALAKEITDEGIILLKNTDGFLPLTDKTINIFGAGAYEMRLSGGGSGASDVSRAINIFDSLEAVGITFNQELDSVYKELGYSTEITSQSGIMGIISMLGSSSETEPALDYLTDDVITQAQSFSSNALIVLTSDSVEASDADPYQLTVKGNKLELINKVSENFENVILVINAGNTLELGFVEEIPSIKSVLYIGTPGATGPMSLAQTIVGEINPSGHLSDTLVYDNTTAPGSENFDDFKYENIEGMGLLEYEEGIYVGYRYYETRYQNDEKAYQEAVLYPFGFGISYTDFEWEVLSHSFDEETIRVEVQVTNVGDVAGKDVVQVYFEPPYYEGGIEKSAIVLADYAKTDLLSPNESQTLVIEYPVRQMASWDMENEEAYVLDHGTYAINVSTNVHDTVESLEFVLEDTIVYSESTSGYAYENQFEYANGDLTYLSRNDWEGTYPTSDDINLVASDDVVDAYMLSVQKCEYGIPYNIASNTEISIKEVLNILLDNSKVAIDIKQDEKRMRPSDLNRLKGNADRFISQTGWKQKYDVKKILLDLLDYWREKI